MGATLHAAPSKSYAFSTNYYACIAMPTWHRSAPPILFWPLPPYNLLLRLFLTWIFFVNAHWWVLLCVWCPAEAMPFQQISIHAIAIPTWHWCAPPILFWPWPPYSLLQRSCLTWIFFVNAHLWVSLCVQCPAKAMPFQLMIILALHYQHYVDVHLLFCFHIDLNLTCSQVHV